MADLKRRTNRETGRVKDDSRKRPYNPGRPQQPIFLGVLIILTTFVGFGGWAAMAPLDSAVMAPATVVVESNRKVVQHPEGGVIERIAVAEGTRVDSDDLLVAFDATEARANFAAVRQQLNSALARQARLRAERSGANMIAFPQELIALAAGADGSQAREVMAAQRNQFQQRGSALANKVEIHAEKIAQLEDRIAGLEAQRASHRRQVAIMRDELVGLRELHEKGYYPRTRILEMERELARLEGEIGARTASIAEARNSIGEAELTVDQVRQDFDEQVAAAMSETDDRVAELRQKLVVAARRLEQTRIYAPHAGIVQDVAVHTVGGVVRAGDEIMQIVPVGDELLLEARVPPRDIDIVRVGQTAEVRLTALSGRTTPSLAGVVRYLSADRIVEQRPDGKPAQTYYKARVEIPTDELEKLGTQALQAGMPAEVMIQTGEQTVADYVMRPVTDAMARGFIEK